MLSNLDDLLSKCQQIKLLVCVEQLKPEDSHQVNTSFLVQSEVVHVEKWDAKGNSGQIIPSTQYGHNHVFEIQTNRPGDAVIKRNSGQLLCRLSGSQEVGHLISVLLTRMNDTWSIKEVYKRKAGSREQKSSILFTLPILADRCRIRFPDQRCLYVKLRRLSSSGRIPQQNALEARYQLSLDWTYHARVT